MTIEEIKSIAGTWFEWPSDDRYHVTYTSAMLFARDMYQLGQKAERERIKQIIEEVSWQGDHDKWFDCVDALVERIEQ
jgi:hypothetical protein